jgi:hypothetical protein
LLTEWLTVSQTNLYATPEAVDAKRRGHSSSDEDLSRSDVDDSSFVVSGG